MSLERPYADFSLEALNPLSRSALKEAEASAIPILEQCDPVLLGNVLHSLRRVAAIYSGSVQNTFYDTPYGVLDRIPDICYDLQSFAGIETDAETVRKYLGHICCLETAFYPLATAKTRLLPYDLKSSIGDFSEIESVAQSIIERSVWNLWQPPEGANIEELFVNLTRQIMGYLRKLPYVARRSIIGERGFQFSSLETMEEDFGWEPEFGLQANGETETDYQNALTAWHEAVKKLNFPQIIYFIEQLEPRLQLALLDKLHYLYPYLSQKERLKIYGMNASTLRQYIIEACQSFIDLMVPLEFLTGEEIPTQTLSLLMARLIDPEQPVIIQMNQRVLHCDSPRFTLLAKREDPAFLAKLNLQERKVLLLATTIADGEFVHTNTAIGEQIGLAPGTIEWILSQIGQIASSDESRFPSRHTRGGAAVLETSAQYKMVCLKPDLTPGQLAALSPLERKVFDYLTTPDENGIFPRQAEAQKALGYKDGGLPPKIVAALEDPFWVFDLKRKIQAVLSGDRAGFNQSMIVMMEYILEQISQGNPLRSKTNNSLAWLQIARALKLPDHFSEVLRNKLEKI